MCAMIMIVVIGAFLLPPCFLGWSTIRGIGINYCMESILL